MPSPSEYYQITATSGSKYIESQRVLTSTQPFKILSYEFPVARNVSSTLEDLMDEFTTMAPENADLLKEARKWVGTTFYEDRPGLAQFRLSKGLSQKQLAELAATSQSYISRLEHGGINPKRTTLKKIAAALGVSIQDLDEALKS